MSIISTYIEALNRCLTEIDHSKIEEVTEVIFNLYRADGQIFIFGNGGSASTSSHFARDLSIGAAVKGKPRIKAHSLTDNVALLTALANDINYESIFKEQLIGCLNKGDVAIGISASGNSPNVLTALRQLFHTRRKTVTSG